jgi:hypothetical protein
MIERPTFSAQILTVAMQLAGRAEPIGPWLDFLNSRDKINMSMRDARVVPLVAGAAPVDRPQIFMNRNLISLMVLTDPGVRDSINMMKNTALAIFHIGPVICRGEIHIGVDTPLGLYFDDLTGNFFPVTNASLHSLTTLPIPLPRQADLVMVNRMMVQAYYPG